MLVTNSPYVENPMNLHAVAFLWFTGYTLPREPHSPVVEAITSMRLYLLQWRDIEQVAIENDGIHNENVSSTCSNTITSALLMDFEEGVKRNIVHWPRHWKYNPELKKIPTFNWNCAPPSEEVHKKTME